MPGTGPSGAPIPIAFVVCAAILMGTTLVAAQADPAAAARYRARQFDLDDLRRVELPWTKEARLQLPAKKPRDRNGVPLFRWRDGRLYYRPGTLAINGMKRLDHCIERGVEGQLTQAEKQAAQLRRMALRRWDAMWIPFEFDYEEAGQFAPWYDAMPQGLALSFFVRLHRVTGDEIHLKAAHKVFRSFVQLDRGRRPWVTFVDAERYLWLEHYPRRRPYHVLNGGLHAVIGIYEYWQATRDREARRILEGALTTMRDHAQRYRRPGGLSLYALRWRSTHVKYHEIHIWQLKLLGRVSGDRWFWRLGNLLSQDVAPRGYVPGWPSVLRWPDGQAPARSAGARGTLETISGAAAPRAIASRARSRAAETRERSARRRDARARARAAAAAPQNEPDFDADGFADLAIGAPYANVRSPDSGAVHVLYGSDSGLTQPRRQLWTQSSPGIADYPERGDHFGWSVVDGDFDGDGFADLAISARWEDRAAPHGGAVHVLYGSPAGLTSEAAQLWHQGSPGIGGAGSRDDAFGWALAAGDFDGDEHHDLAIAVHGDDPGARNAGSVRVLYGSPAGLTSLGSQVWHQGTSGIADHPEGNDGFGKAIATGDFDGDRFDDLAVGAPYESRGVHRMGIVHIIRGSRRGLTARGDQVWHQDSPGIAEEASLRDQFGQSLATGDFDRDRYDDLAVGVWFEDYRNELSNEGGFHMIYGSRRGLTSTGDQFWHQDRPGVLDRTEDSDRFGQALAALDVDGDRFDDLAVGCPSCDLGKGIHQNRGAVQVFLGSRTGLTARGDRYLTQDSPGVRDRSEPWDHFGEKVGGADFDGDGFDDLVVGVPYEDMETADDGMVHVLPGSSRGVGTSRDRVLGPGGSGQPIGARRGGRFGWSVSSVHPGDGAPRTGRPRL